MRISLFASFLLLVSPHLNSGSWPSWRGTSQNGHSEEQLQPSWPDSGPKILWKASVGLGFSSLVSDHGKVLTTGHANDQDTLWCFDTQSGKLAWKYSYDSDLGDKYFEGGTTGTPTIHGKQVLLLGRWGDLFCFEIDSGKVKWHVNVQKTTGCRIPDWGYSGAPLVVGDKIILNVGEAGAAVSLTDGKLLWKSADKNAGYSTPLKARLAGKDSILIGSEKAYVAVDADTGKQLWQFPWTTQYGVNAADPVLDGNRVLISSGYGKGAVFLDLTSGTPKPLWENKNLRTQMNPGILRNGFVYGIDGDTTSKASLKCLELATGRIQWTEAGIGSGTVISVGDKLLVLTDKGELILAAPSNEKFTPLARTQILGGKCWTVPIVANGKLFARNSAGNLVCVQVGS